MSTLERTTAIAAKAHAGQVDMAGKPYILHPLRIMLQMETNDERIVAVLHDVVEDCGGGTLDRLREEGFSEEVVQGVDAATKREGEIYDTFVIRAGEDPLGRRVKLADLQDNIDLSRIAEPSPKDHERVTRYQRAITSLGGG